MEAGAIALVSLYCSYKVNVLQLRKLASAGVTLALVGHGLSLTVDMFWVFVLCRIIAGIGEGMALVAANTAGAAVKNSDRAFALARLDEHGAWTTLAGTVMSFAIAFSPVFSRFIAAHAGYVSMGWFTAGCCITALSMLLAVRQSLSRINPKRQS